jgi:ATP-dependent Lon protease
LCGRWPLGRRRTPSVVLRAYAGDPSSALLEVLDPEQNHAFRDHFLNVPFDLSRVFFIATANELEPIPRPLRDRMEVIEMSGYTVQEKVQIAMRHLLPKQRRLHGLTEDDLDIDEEAIDALIAGYTLEAGVRELDRQVAALCRWVAARAAEAAEVAEAAQEAMSAADDAADDDGAAADEGADAAAAEAGASDAAGVEWSGGMVRVEDIITVLGPPKFDGPRDNMHRLSKPGTAVGLAYTPVGGCVLYVEAETMSGKGELAITGKLGDVMVESVKIAQVAADCSHDTPGTARQRARRSLCPPHAGAQSPPTDCSLRPARSQTHTCSRSSTPALSRCGRPGSVRTRPSSGWRAKAHRCSTALTCTFTSPPVRCPRTARQRASPSPLPSSLC